MLPSTARPKTLQLALTATLGALAASVSLGLPGVPYPLLFFLKFDLAEVVDTLAFFLLGPSSALSVAVIHWMALNLHSPSVPVVGPTMKFAAVLSMLLGFWAATALLQRLHRRLGHRKFMLALYTFGSATRVLIMAVLTFALYSFLLPSTYIPFGKKALSLLGVTFANDLEVVLVIVALTALFNAVHALLTLVPSYLLANALIRSPRVIAINPWIGQLVGVRPQSNASQLS